MPEQETREICMGLHSKSDIRKAYIPVW